MSVPRAAFVIFCVVLLALGVVLFGVLRDQSADENNPDRGSNVAQQAEPDELLCVQAQTDDECIYTEVVAAPEELRRGLSGRETLPEDHGMLFDFGQMSQHCMWMPDMAFAIDIVWLDAEQRIVTIKPDITPETYPESFCGDPAEYVLEVNSGVVAERNWRVGQQLLW